MSFFGINLVQPIASVLVLGILIFVHELGHFLVAKWNGIGVLEFSIGFGKKLIKWTRGETTYSIGIIPLGGYVRMIGDDPREVNRLKDAEASADEPESPPEPVNKELEKVLADRSRWFLEKGYFAKAAVVLAGPGFNILFAWFISIAAISYYGKAVPVDAPVIGEVLPGEPAEKAGIRAKDLVKSIDGKPLTTWIELATTVATSGGKEMEFVIERQSDGGASKVTQEIIKVAGTTDNDMAAIQGDTEKKIFRIGIYGDTLREPVGVAEAVKISSQSIWGLSVMIVRGLGAMVKGAISPKKIAGPIFIFTEAARSASQGMERVASFMIFLSVTLAIMNLLPIPVLDGGHLVFFTIEALKGGPVSLRVQEMANQVGIFLLLLLMVFAVGNDLTRLFF